MAHPMCGANLRKGTKVVAFGDAILSGLTIFTAILVLNCLFNKVTSPENSAFAIGGLIIFIALMVINIFLAFRLYRSAHERNLERLKQYRETALIIMLFASVLGIFIRHTADNNDLLSRYPLLWFYIMLILTTVFRAYMYFVVKAFLEEFQIP